MSHYTEDKVVEEPIINELKKLGWEYIDPIALSKKRNNDLGEVLLIDEVKNAIRRINSNLELSDNDLDTAVEQLRNIPPTLEGIKKFLDYFKNGMLISIEKENREESIRLFDLERIDNNSFIVTNQFKVEGLSGIIRADIVLFVNGIPLVLIETKNPTIESKDWRDAYNDIKVYEEKVPDLFKFVQISIATDGEKSCYFPNAYNEKGKDILNQWKDPYPYSSNELGNDKLLITIYGLLSKKNLLDLLENFTFVKEERSGSTKITARYMQFRAANRIYERVVDWVKGRDDKRFGLIWHWQGSGKTYTMAFSAWKLYHSRELDKPTIFIMVDRRDLEEQINLELNSIKVPFERIGSIKELIEVLRWGNEGKRGIFLVTIEKFSPKDFDELEKEISNIKRRNVTVLADEVHRTHYGKLATVMRSTLQNASIFGFTGTPLSREDRNTFRKFTPQDELYLDRYSMNDALDDCVTVPISYQPRLPEYHLEYKDLDELLEVEEVIESLSEEEKKLLNREVNPIKALLTKDARIDKITSSIAEHFKEVVEPTGMKAMVVTFDRSACVKYKEFLDKKLGEGYTEVVMSMRSKEKDDKIREFVTKQQSKYKTSEAREINEKIVDEFKRSDKPKMLIVTDMLITGFDAPNLWAMYVDKPLREHRLLQTTARTNRPFKSKMFGLIIDYIGILKDLERALKEFEADDVKRIRTVIRELSGVVEEFKRELCNTLSIFDNIKRDNSRNSLNEALDRLLDSKIAKRFEDSMKRLMGYYEMLKGDASVRDSLSDYTWLTKIYVAYNRRYKRANVDEMMIDELSKKTMELIQEAVDVGDINNAYPIKEIDGEFINAIKSGNNSMGFAIDIISNLVIEVKKHQSSPFYLNLRKRVEQAYEDLRSRKRKVEDIIMEMSDLANKVVERKREEESIGSDVYSIYEVLQDKLANVKKDELIEFSRDLLEHLKKNDLLFKGWQKQLIVRRDVKKEIRIKLLKFRNDTNIDELLDSIFTLLAEKDEEA